MKSFWLIIVVLLSVSIKICYGVTCKFFFKEFKKLRSHTWCCPARVDNQERVNETSSVGNNLSKDDLSDSLFR